LSYDKTLVQVVEKSILAGLELCRNPQEQAAKGKERTGKEKKQEK